MANNHSELIGITTAFVQQELAEAEGGHDWWHIYRVWQQARHIAAEENVDLVVVELAALLHDIADPKFHGGDESIGPAKAAAFMRAQAVPEETAWHVENIIRYMSFKNALEKRVFYSPEMGVVQDADRLDAMGAIGIARAFNYGGFKNRALYDPAVAPNLQMSKEEYKHSSAPTINHFYEKLLLLKDMMNTATGRRLAAERHAYMETYLERFYKEWEGEW
ncbi:HD domain-containing protein [Chitinophaga lutea]|uniref:HD domain-containing protein n=1 Tax=Chitinophaga lutea TaxID=2488634 RepID=A0A3N4PBD0_9BACT|nr:HD domain-containing protein [Chitinophaga lutea]RPE05982.1 HD domain-containing protein [Chitinophaga lutea]